MTLEEFREKYNYAPYTEDEFVYGALQVENCSLLVRRAKEVKRAKRKFNELLERKGVYYG